MKEEVINISSSKPTYNGLICFYTVVVIMQQYLSKSQCELDRLDDDEYHHGLYLASLIEASSLQQLPVEFVPDKNIKSAAKILSKFILTKKQATDKASTCEKSSLFSVKKELTEEESREHVSSQVSETESRKRLKDNVSSSCDDEQEKR